MTTKQLSAKDAAEVIVITFDFSSLVATIDSASLSITVVSGIDADASAMLSGSPQITGAKALQLLQNGINGVTYNLRCEALSGSEKFALSALIPVSGA